MSETRKLWQTVQVVCGLWLFERHVLSLTLSQGPSMQPTLREQGDVLLLDRAYPSAARPVSVGDVVVCESSDQENYSIVKRVVGVGGDELSREEWLHPYVVPPGHVWLEGDNAANSRDSRHYGAVPSALVRGRVLAVVWPPWLWRAIPPAGEPPAPSKTVPVPRGSAALAAQAWEQAVAAQQAQAEGQQCDRLLQELLGHAGEALGREALAELAAERRALQLLGGRQQSFAELVGRVNALDAARRAGSSRELQ
jgi:inner membrane protease subunit 1